MISQIYVKSTDDVTSIIVSNDTGVIYFDDVIDVPELTGIQRAASFIKNHLKDSEKTEIYSDKLKPSEFMKDAYLNYCKIKHEVGKNPNEKTQEQCNNSLQSYLRWSVTRIYQSNNIRS